MSDDPDTPKSSSLQNVSVLLVTANVGSLFENPEQIMTKWIEKFIEVFIQSNPLFVAIHLQEVGGKTYEKSSDDVQRFVNDIINNEYLKDFTSYHIFLDDEFKRKESFTALGSIYLIHKQISSDVRIWNFEKLDWESVSMQQIHIQGLDSVPTKEKSKFPQHFFPECKWSRKGFMRTRWDLMGSSLDLVNIHLFHDASNLVSCTESPSVYAKLRQKALLYTIERFYADTKNGFVPFIVFGDFNFRCDTKKVLNELSKDLIENRYENIKNDVQLIYKSEDGQEILCLGKKEFKHINHDKIFIENWLKSFDEELEQFQNFLFEFNINFPPSYPFEECQNLPSDYMKTRCPAWCDRILFSQEAKELIFNEESLSDVEYSRIGDDVCMGDHKPIYLQFSLRPLQDKAVHEKFSSSLREASLAKIQKMLDPAVATVPLEEICTKSQYVQINYIQEEGGGTVNSTQASNLLKETSL